MAETVTNMIYHASHRQTEGLTSTTGRLQLIITLFNAHVMRWSGDDICVNDAQWRIRL